MSDSDSVSSREAVVKQQMQSLSQLSPGGEKRSSKKARELHEENKLLNRLGGIPTAAPVGALKHIYRRGKFLPEEDKLLKDLFAQAAYELNLDSEAARDVSRLEVLLLLQTAFVACAVTFHTNKRA